MPPSSIEQDNCLNEGIVVPEAGIGVVAIGRNEGERLERCFESLPQHLIKSAIYVDSGSTDFSIEKARACGLMVIELTNDKPFTAARARNEGFAKLLTACPTLRYVFFVDGDCQIAAGWLPSAAAFLDQNPEVAVVWGRRRERHPKQSVYNMLCDIEWDSRPLGESKDCGGDAVIRVDAFQKANGYRSDLICGEEPELCVRLRKFGWKIWHVGDEMTLHDAALLRFSQWWRRVLRGGYAYAQGVHLHGGPPTRHWVWESLSAWAWGLVLPAFITMLSAAYSRWAILLVLLYPLQVFRLAMLGHRSTRENWWRAGSLVLAKFPEMLGQLKYTLDRLFSTQSRIIEYK